MSRKLQATYPLCQEQRWGVGGGGGRQESDCGGPRCQVESGLSRGQWVRGKEGLHPQRSTLAHKGARAQAETWSSPPPGASGATRGVENTGSGPLLPEPEFECSVVLSTFQSPHLLYGNSHCTVSASQEEGGRLKGSTQTSTGACQALRGAADQNPSEKPVVDSLTSASRTALGHGFGNRKPSLSLLF